MEMFEFLQSSETLAPFVANGQLVFPSEKKDHFAFWLIVPNKTTFDKISCAVLFNQLGYHEEDGVCPGGKSPMVFETALVKDDTLIYVKDLAYNDVQRFTSFKEVVDEICRLITTDDSAMSVEPPFD